MSSSMASTTSGPRIGSMRGASAAALGASCQLSVVGASSRLQKPRRLRRAVSAAEFLTRMSGASSRCAKTMVVESAMCYKDNCFVCGVISHRMPKSFRLQKVLR